MRPYGSNYSHTDQATPRSGDPHPRHRRGPCVSGDSGIARARLPDKSGSSTGKLRRGDTRTTGLRFAAVAGTVERAAGARSHARSTVILETVTDVTLNDVKDNARLPAEPLLSLNRAKNGGIGPRRRADDPPSDGDPRCDLRGGGERLHPAGIRPGRAVGTVPHPHDARGGAGCETRLLRPPDGGRTRRRGPARPVIGTLPSRARRAAPAGAATGRVATC